MQTDFRMKYQTRRECPPPKNILSKILSNHQQLLSNNPTNHWEKKLAEQSQLKVFSLAYYRLNGGRTICEQSTNQCTSNWYHTTNDFNEGLICAQTVPREPQNYPDRIWISITKKKTTRHDTTKSLSLIRLLTPKTRPTTPNVWTGLHRIHKSKHKRSRTSPTPTTPSSSTTRHTPTNELYLPKKLSSLISIS